MDRKLKKLPKRLLILICLMVWGSVAAADSVSLKETVVKNKVSVDALFAHLRLPNDPVSGMGLQANMTIGINDKFGLGIQFGHALTIPASTLFIQVSLEAKWAITGALFTREQTVSSEARSIIKTQSGNSGGLMLHGYIHEYIINRNYLMQRFSGLGTALSYELPSKSDVNIRGGIRTDYSIRENASFMALQVFGGVSLRF